MTQMFNRGDQSNGEQPWRLCVLSMERSAADCSILLGPAQKNAGLDQVVLNGGGAKVASQQQLHVDLAGPAPQIKA